VEKLRTKEDTENYCLVECNTVHSSRSGPNISETPVASASGKKRTLARRGGSRFLCISCSVCK